MDRDLNTIDDYIAMLQDARAKVGGHIEVRFVNECYVHDRDEHYQPEDVILFGSQSMIRTNKNCDKDTRLLFTVH